MPLDADLDAWLRLCLLPGLGPQSLRKLLVAHGTPANILAANPRDLRATVAEKIASAIHNGGADDNARASVAKWLENSANHVITLADAEYPQTLLQISDPPPLIYVKGRCDLLNRDSFAVVGSRNATAQGVNNAEAFSAALSNAGLTIVSGLALGIDAAAHRGGLRGAGSTIAVVGTGLDIVYPAHNRALAHEIAENGALVSEFALGTPALASNFPRRNRLICGLSRGCLVIEAAISSGSLITARLAAEQGRDVFAIPGSIHSPLAKGCHALIKQGAKLVESAQDVLEELGLIASTTEPAKPLAEPQGLLNHIGHDPCDLEALKQRSGMETAAIIAALTALELDGFIESLPGGRWQRIH